MASSSDVNIEQREVNNKRFRYIPLLKATLKGDWKTAERFFEQDRSALTATFGERKDTVLHIAVGIGKEKVYFVEKLVNLMPVGALAATNRYNHTALHIAATVGNTKAAAILVERHRPLLYIGIEFLDEGSEWFYYKYVNSKYNWPIHFAAHNARRDTVLYLLDVIGDDVAANNWGDGPPPGHELIIFLISSNLYDIALNLVERYPSLAIYHGYCQPLQLMATKVSAFPSGSRLNFWQRKIYAYVPVENCSIKEQNKTGQVEINIPQAMSHAHKDNWAQSFRKNVSISVPQIKRILEEKRTNVQARQLVKTLVECCKRIPYSNFYKEYPLTEGMLTAISKGLPEVIEEIDEWFPILVSTNDNEGHNFLQRAILNRDEKVFNLVYQMSDHKYIVTNIRDRGDGNNILHLAGHLAPVDKRTLVPALQMQRELQWFEEVKKFVPPIYVQRLNKDGKTPAMVFTEKHRHLVAEGEQWMKGTANSLIIPAALIVTVVFAAAITVPGGNNGNSGRPIFSQKVAFTVFAVSDAISFFMSATSLFMFLSILTSRYDEGDFLHVLPKKLIIGLSTLFVSITTMTVAFSCALYLVFGQNKAWILGLVAVLSCLPISSFITSQFCLLTDTISSTYGKGIFGKQSDRVLY